MSLRRAALGLLAPVTALAFSLLVATLALLLVGIDPILAFTEMAKFSASLPSFVSIVNRAVPLFVSGLAVAVGFKMGLFNIGVEGQYLIAAVIAAYVGALLALPPPIHVAAVLVVAMAVGAFWAGIAGVLKVRRGVHEVISTIMLNFIAIGLVAWLLSNYFREDEPQALSIRTPELPPSGRFPSLNPLLEALGLEIRAGSDLQGFVVLAALLGVFYYLLVWRSRFGFELRASGLNPAAARVSGVDPRAMVIKTMLLSGAIAGLVAMSPLLGSFHRYTQDFPTQLGFVGIAVALLGRNHPVGIALGALLFGLMDRSAQILDLRDIPREIVIIIQGVVVLAVVIAYEMVTRLILQQEIKAAAGTTEEADHQREAVSA
ncbi:MAG: ABC transporter permease [Actinomycetota bacterium]|nr:ABC transporter permease [Actinomycetota bacterium]